MKNIIRTHDSFYLSENRYEDPKQLHLEIIGRIRAFLRNNKSLSKTSILDVGCAAGEFAYILKKSFPALSVVGFDLLPELVDKAKKYAENCTFYQGDILKPSSSPKNFAQIVTCTGVLSIFDSFESCIDNLIYWAKPGGIIFLHSLFNNYPVDVQIKYNLSHNYGQGVLESGWNIFSKESVSSHLNKLKSKNVIKSFVFHDFEMRREILKKEDIIRSWTQRNENGQYQITNALMLLQPHSVLEIRK